MSFLKKLFGGGAAAQEPAAPTQEHKGFTITATPASEGGQWRVCGLITKTVDGAAREHVFNRADRSAAKDEAVEMTFRKARQIIDEQGDRLFG
ncbi:HlyU family transcriptional regulator [Chthonobacter rhizosphaerae]|uniref:HlyU family transcriptional regulator n=1 Tax=Chthonobacter rhizosphaerae TaxID=2735553 RepID=UPI0015EF5A77|nr:HlyU family transcriptional regulator [Chthonobacter rhizosphaerae]